MSGPELKTREHARTSLTSFRLKVRDAVHDDVMEEQGFVVDLDVSREQTPEVLHVPGDQRFTGGTTVNFHLFNLIRYVFKMWVLVKD